MRQQGDRRQVQKNNRCGNKRKDEHTRIKERNTEARWRQEKVLLLNLVIDSDEWLFCATAGHKHTLQESDLLLFLYFSINFLCFKVTCRVCSMCLCRCNPAGWELIRRSCFLSPAAVQTESIDSNRRLFTGTKHNKSKKRKTNTLGWSLCLFSVFSLSCWAHFLFSHSCMHQVLFITSVFQPAVTNTDSVYFSAVSLNASCCWLLSH